MGSMVSPFLSKNEHSQRVCRLAMLGVFYSLSWTASAQTPINSQLDGTTPPALAPGSPAGSYALGGFDTINLYSGALNFRLPLVSVGGRNATGFTLALPIQQLWHVELANFCEGGSCQVGVFP